MSEWYASGRGIFCRDAGFQLATMPLTVNWQEDTARIVDLLNKGAQCEERTNTEAAKSFDRVRSIERARLAAKMRADYPQNRHALEWADWIERESEEQEPAQ